MGSTASIVMALLLAPEGQALRGQDPERQEPERLPVQRAAQEEDLEAMRPGFDPFHPVPPRPLPRTPLRVSSNNLLHGLFGLLPLESAETLEEGRVDVGLFEDISSGDLEETTPDYFFRYDATLVETNLVARAGLPEDWEVGAGLDVSDLLEDEGDIILARRGKILIQEGRRHTAVGDIRLWTKKRLFSIGEAGALSLLAGAKVPVSRSKDDLLTSGGVDFAAGLLWTQEFGALTFHANLGAIIPGDVQVFEEDVETRNAFTFGAGAVYEFAAWGALAGQIQGNQSVFEDSNDSIAILDKTAVTAHFGGRFRVGSYFLEASVGTGLTDQSADLILQISFSLPL